MENLPLNTMENQNPSKDERRGIHLRQQEMQHGKNTKVGTLKKTYRQNY